jgi:hypothetical protein
MDPLSNAPGASKTYLDKERLLEANGVAVPPYPKPPSVDQVPGSIEEANFLAAFDSWELEINRLYEGLLKDHPELR